MENITEYTQEIVTVAGAAAISVWSAYQNFDNQPSWKKALMILGPIVALGIALAVVA
jgi:hypothetical protein